MPFISILFKATVCLSQVRRSQTLRPNLKRKQAALPACSQIFIFSNTPSLLFLPFLPRRHPNSLHLPPNPLFRPSQWWPRSIESTMTFTISATAFETSIATLLGNVDLDNPTFQPFKETTFDKVRDLLAGAGKSEWSKRLRTYIVLRLIDRVDAMDSFVLQGFLDMHFSCVESQLPQLLSATSRSKFLNTQRLALSDAKEVEFGNRHNHFRSDANN